MSIIITILKIIGISVLMMLGILILLILLALFWPLRYKAAGSYAQEGIDVLGKVRWLMGAVSLTMQYKGGQPFRMKAKVFFFTVFDNLKKSKKFKKKRKRKRISSEKPQLQAASSANDDYIDEEAVQEDIAAEEAACGEIKKEKKTEEDFAQNDSKTTESKIKGFLKKLVEVFQNIKFTFRKIYVIIVKIRDNIKYYWELLQQENTKQAFRLCSRQFSRIFKNISPKKYEVKLHIGFEDPAAMGNLLAVWGMLYPFHMGKADIIPEFDRKILEGSFKIKGIVSVYILLWTVWLLMTDKNIKRLRRELDI